MRSKRSPVPGAPYAGRQDLVVRTRICLTPEQRRREREGPKLNTPLAAAGFCRHLADLDQEVMVVVSLTAKGGVISVFEAAVGGTKNVAASMQHALKVPVIMGAHKVVLVHNHPSGDPSPSESDRRYYERARRAFELVGPRLLDSIIVADGGFYSFAVGSKSGWEKPTAASRREVYRQTSQAQRRDNPPTRLRNRSLMPKQLEGPWEEFAERCVPFQAIVGAVADLLEFSAGRLRACGLEPGEGIDATVSLLRDAVSGDAVSDDFRRSGSGSRRSEVVADLESSLASVGIDSCGFALAGADHSIGPGLGEFVANAAFAAKYAMEMVYVYARGPEGVADHFALDALSDVVWGCEVACRCSGDGDDAAHSAVSSVFARSIGSRDLRQCGSAAEAIRRAKLSGWLGMRACEIDDGVAAQLVDTHIFEYRRGLLFMIFAPVGAWARRGNPGRVEAEAIDPEAVVRAVRDYRVHPAQVAAAQAETLEAAAEELRASGVEPGEGIDAAVSLLRDVGAGAASESDFADGGRADYVLREMTHARRALGLAASDDADVLPAAWDEGAMRAAGVHRAAQRAINDVGLYCRQSEGPSPRSVAGFLIDCAAAVKGRYATAREGLSAVCAHFVRALGELPTRGEMLDPRAVLRLAARRNWMGVTRAEADGRLLDELVGRGLLEERNGRLVATDLGEDTTLAGGQRSPRRAY